MLMPEGSRRTAPSQITNMLGSASEYPYSNASTPYSDNGES